jgi:cytochrome c-type biogenesis protein CcmH
MQTTVSRQQATATLIIGCSIAFLIIFAGALSAATQQEQEVIVQLMCPCPDKCGKALENCTCSNSVEYKTEIRNLLGTGQAVDDIVEVFVDKYGETVRTAPKMSGFGLTAYLMPLAMITFGTLVAILLIRRWTRKQACIDSLPEITAEEEEKIKEMVSKWKS